MEDSKLKPFLRRNLDILFVGLNPAKGSSRNGHYFSVNSAFWNQLYNSGLILDEVDKIGADNIVFGTNSINYNSSAYGVTDLVVEIAESDSSKIKPKISDCDRLKSAILKYSPKIVVILHGKVLKTFLKYLSYPVPPSNSGSLGTILEDCDSIFYNIGFPHGNSIKSCDKILKYQELISILKVSS